MRALKRIMNYASESADPTINYASESVENDNELRELKPITSAHANIECRTHNALKRLVRHVQVVVRGPSDPWNDAHVTRTCLSRRMSSHWYSNTRKCGTYDISAPKWK